jgi:uncharacterized protein (TIGR03437 family)
MKSISIRSVLLVACLAPGLLPAQSFDNSGNSLLQGSYFIRQVLFQTFNSGYAPTQAISLTGMVTFSGSGSYTLTGQQSTSGSSSVVTVSLSGAYAVSSSGVLRMDDPLSSGDSLFGGVGTSALVASATESTNVIDAMIAVPISGSGTNASLSGQYRVASMDVTGASVTQTRNASFLINADGSGNLGTLAVLGQAANSGDKEVTQTLSGATYSIAGTTGTMTFPAISVAASQTQLISGTKQFAISSDGNVFVGGSVNGYDLVVGIKAGTGGNSSFTGAYYSVGLDYDNSQASQGTYYFDGYYGSINANAAGTVLQHQRVAASAYNTYDYTFDDMFTVNGGAVTETYQRFWVSANGQAVLGVGRSSSYGLNLSVTAKTLPASGSVYLNPVGVTNAANYTPVTNPVTPGEMIRLYGSNLASASVTASGVPFPTTLGNTKVTVNGIAAPIYSVSANQVVAIVPYGIDPNTVYYAQFQVINNGVASNQVTMFTETAAPGVFTIGQNGVGDAAALHPNGSVVGPSNPALIGETIAAYLTGLGAVSPAVNDGAAAPGNPLSSATDSISVYVDGTQVTPTYAGLAPGFVGLYQINFAIPTGTSTGEVFVDISDDTNGAYNSMATLYVGAAKVGASVPAQSHAARPRVNGRKSAGSRVPLQGISRRGSY